MKILIGIMCCIENELEQCLNSIQTQTYLQYDYFLISNLSNKEAHNLLYKTFMDHADDVDLFIKIDADMVLLRPTFFEEVTQKFMHDPTLVHIQIALDDWFTQRKIMGLHIYRSNYQWICNQEAHFVDMVDSPNILGTTINDWNDLAPAAVHCPSPSPFQAFHFGVHKAVKVLQQGRTHQNISFSCTHWSHFQNMEAHYAKTQDLRLALALAGFLHSIKNLYEPRHVDYACGTTREAFEYYESLSENGLDDEIRSFFPYGTGWIPHSFRFEMAIYKAKSKKNIADFLKLFAYAFSNRLNRRKLY